VRSRLYNRAMVTVHHLNNSRSQRVLWLLEELGTPYELVKYERDPKTLLAPDSLRKVHPLGKSPVITDDGVTVAESGAILEHLVDKYGGGRFAPARGTPHYARYRYYMHYAEGSLMPLLLLRLIFARVKVKAPWLVRPIARKIADTVDSQFVGPNLARHMAFLDTELGAAPWFCGDEPTAADIQMIYPMEAIATRVPGAPAKIKGWVARAHARPAYQRALERGGPYSVEP
jgi:glutathione S-transferase